VPKTKLPQFTVCGNYESHLHCPFMCEHILANVPFVSDIAVFVLKKGR